MGKILLKNILVCINGSKSSILAAKYAVILAKQNKLNLKFVFVVDTQTLSFLTNQKYLIIEESRDYEVNLERDGKNYLDYVANLSKSKGVNCETELLHGSVVLEILKSAESFNSDLIILGGKKNSRNNYSEVIQNRKKIAHSVKTELMEFANCPVMVVHNSEVDDLFKVF